MSVFVTDYGRSATADVRRENVATICLYGIGGVYNYGCEAVIRGTSLLLREGRPDMNVVYLSPRLDDDVRRLDGSGVEVRPRQWYPRYHPRKLAAKAATLLDLPWQPRTENLSAFDHADVVLSIGGDLYTVGHESGRFARWLIESGETAMVHQVPFVIWGASIGPFESNVEAKRVITDHLRRVSLITVREPATIEYLRTLGITENVVGCADPAFAVNNPEPRRVRSGRRIGVNYSPISLAYERAHGSVEHLSEQQAAVLAEMARRHNADLMLIPHVVCDFTEDDDDRRYADRLCSLASKLTTREVRVIDHDPGFCGLRDDLLSCDIVIAARMHCAINAISLGVPTILAAYSQKAVGMARYVYGHGRWMVPIQATTDGTIVAKAGELLSEQAQVHEQLINRLPRIQADARRGANALQQVLRH